MSQPIRAEDGRPSMIGPILYARGADAAAARLSAVIALREDTQPPALLPEDGEAVPMARLVSHHGWTLWRADFALPAKRMARYSIGESEYQVATDLTGDTRIAYVSCNGQEYGETERDLGERNVMWRRLAEQHDSEPFALLLQGGDQLYADAIKYAHPDLERWSKTKVDERPSVPFTEAARAAAHRYLFFRYLDLMAQPAIAHMVSHVPSLMMWDDHDILDGWGSHPPAWLDGPVGQGVFAVAREMFMLFQLGAVESDLPAICFDRTGRSFTLAARFPGFNVIAPDLRSERRPERVMGEAGWRTLGEALAESRPGDMQFVMSSVPALAPRLSWVEALLDFIPGSQEYEDDLRDQWQSRIHREEWCRFLAAMEDETVDKKAPVVLLSGEIHLATRGEMRLRDGRIMHQLVSSGIAHPRPHPFFAVALSLLAKVGDAPLPGRPIRMRAVPGRFRSYTSQRNYLLLTRRDGHWQAEWELQRSGRTPPLPLGSAVFNPGDRRALPSASRSAADRREPATRLSSGGF